MLIFRQDSVFATPLTPLLNFVNDKDGYIFRKLFLNFVPLCPSCHSIRLFTIADEWCSIWLKICTLQQTLVSVIKLTTKKNNNKKTTQTHNARIHVLAYYIWVWNGKYLIIAIAIILYWFNLHNNIRFWSELIYFSI